MGPIAAGAPASWLEALAPWPEAVGWDANRPTDLARLTHLAAERACRSGAGVPLRFLSAHSDADLEGGYEQRIFDQGAVATRTLGPGAAHDLANALAWLAWPRLKSRLNALHVKALSQTTSEPGRRGRLRDRLTLFDESGALVLTSDPTLAHALQGFRWRELFVERRNDWPQRIRVLPVGHALLEKLRKPYKAICAHAWVLALAPALDLDQIDGEVAARIDAQALASLTPLPLLGIPGWWRANEDPAFYNDPQVFRAGRQR